ncbi:MAG: hypothetical protein ACRBBJ_06555 [Rhodomicrobiaceae bacterium]
MILDDFIWYGNIEIKPLPGCKTISIGCIGAFVNVVAYADSEEEFIGICEDEFLEMNYKIVSIDNITFNLTIEEFNFPDDDVLVKNIRNYFDNRGFVYGTLFSYMAEGEA